MPATTWRTNHAERNTTFPLKRHAYIRGLRRRLVVILISLTCPVQKNETAFTWKVNACELPRLSAGLPQGFRHAQCAMDYRKLCCNTTLYDVYIFCVIIIRIFLLRERSYTRVFLWVDAFFSYETLKQIKSFCVEFIFNVVCWWQCIKKKKNCLIVVKL